HKHDTDEKGASITVAPFFIRLAVMDSGLRYAAPE
ncbi:MAG: hypothetical protein K0Q60_3653, partial [Microvirga sp.]|nr:hypothetical protein [Microvirga sp.]